MAAERLSMRKIRVVLRRYHDIGLTKRQIARSCNIPHSTMLEYIGMAEKADLGWPLPDDLDEAILESRLFAPVVIGPCTRPVPDMEYIHRELRREGVMLQLLGNEYKNRHPDGYQYSRFCDHYRSWAKKRDVSLRQEYRAGESMLVDFAGSGLPVVFQSTLPRGERRVKVFIPTSSGKFQSTLPRGERRQMTL